jgi:F-type H+-transporting ATPase subunit b
MNFALLLAEAGGDPPLVDFDNTVFLQLGIFVIVALVLSRYVFRPYLALRAARDEGIVGARDAARRMDEQAKAQMTDYEARFNRARGAAAEERGKLRGEALARERQITEAARRSAQEVVEAARKQIETEAASARAQLEPRAQEIARTVARKVLGREVTP